MRGVGGWIAGGAALEALALAPARAEEARVTPAAVRLRPEIEPVVRWIETTPRDAILARAAEELRKGLTYRQLLAGLFLAGIRNIKPRPVGFKFHAVMVVEAAHQLGLDAPQSERLLPLFWALDNFKASQDRDVQEGDWTLGPVDEAAVPGPSKARQAFVEAMDRWDAAAADAAVAGLCRAAGAGEVVEILWPYGIRDWQNIGHKIIFTAHAVRTLHTIGWEHAEPVLRSLVFGLLNGSPGDTTAPYAQSVTLAGKARADWASGKPDPAATTALLETLRQAKPEDAARDAADALGRGVAPEALWDAALLAAGELLMRQPGIVALHAWTASNSLHHAYLASGKDATRLAALFQAFAWIPLYRETARSRGVLPDSPRIDVLEPDEAGAAGGVEAVFQDLAKDRLAAARRAMAVVVKDGSAKPFVDAARRLTLTKGTDSHDYKLASAVFEETRLATEAWRPRLLAASLFHQRAASEADSPITERARRAVGGG
ncbi:MAG: hypothetical protein HY721_34055 [Planctomycetes bacterium]|nr:hypothetical protein [Planctomycetota bacterium]